MRRFKHHLEKGSLLLEALVAIGVAAAYMTALVGFVVVANRGSDRAVEIQQAVWNTNEGISALRAVPFASLTPTLTGAITFATSSWTLATNGPQTLPDGSTRLVKIESVSRDASCAVVASGGTVDPDSKKLTSITTWIDTAGRTHDTTTTTLRTNWASPTGSCFATRQAGQVSFSVDASQYYGGKQLRQLYFTNTGGTSVVIDKITFTWSNSSEFEQLFIDNSKVWSTSGPGTPTGVDVHSGTELDIQNFSMTPGQTSQITKGQFENAMAGTTMTMSVTFADGSIFTSAPFNPL
jgi:Tfp pilus assembly protein PilV